MSYRTSGYYATITIEILLKVLTFLIVSTGPIFVADAYALDLQPAGMPDEGRRSPAPWGEGSAPRQPRTNAGISIQSYHRWNGGAQRDRWSEIWTGRFVRMNMSINATPDQKQLAREIIVWADTYIDQVRTPMERVLGRPVEGQRPPIMIRYGIIGGRFAGMAGVTSITLDNNILFPHNRLTRQGVRLLQHELAHTLHFQSYGIGRGAAPSFGQSAWFPEGWAEYWEKWDVTARAMGDFRATSDWRRGVEDTNRYTFEQLRHPRAEEGPVYQEGLSIMVYMLHTTEGRGYFDQLMRFSRQAQTNREQVYLNRGWQQTLPGLHSAWYAWQEAGHRIGRRR